MGARGGRHRQGVAVVGTVCGQRRPDVGPGPGGPGQRIGPAVDVHLHHDGSVGIGIYRPSGGRDAQGAGGNRIDPPKWVVAGAVAGDEPVGAKTERGGDCLP